MTPLEFQQALREGCRAEVVYRDILGATEVLVSQLCENVRLDLTWNCWILSGSRVSKVYTSYGLSGSYNYAGQAFKKPTTVIPFINAILVDDISEIPSYNKLFDNPQSK